MDATEPRTIVTLTIDVARLTPVTQNASALT